MKIDRDGCSSDARVCGRDLIDAELSVVTLFWALCAFLRQLHLFSRAGLTCFSHCASCISMLDIFVFVFTYFFKGRRGRNQYSEKFLWGCCDASLWTGALWWFTALIFMCYMLHVCLFNVICLRLCCFYKSAAGVKRCILERALVGLDLKVISHLSRSSYMLWAIVHVCCAKTVGLLIVSQYKDKFKTIKFIERKTLKVELNPLNKIKLFF